MKDLKKLNKTVLITLILGSLILLKIIPERHLIIANNLFGSRANAAGILATFLLFISIIIYNFKNKE